MGLLQPQLNFFMFYSEAYVKTIRQSVYYITIGSNRNKPGFGIVWNVQIEIIIYSFCFSIISAEGGLLEADLRG